MTINYLFYIVFALQVGLLSHYYPNKIRQRIQFILRHYPPATHPKLYPQSEAKLLAGQMLFKWVSFIILGLGIVLAAVMFFNLQQGATTTSKLAFVPLIFGLVQTLPYLLIELLNKRQLKLMRELNLQSTRKAELAPRHLFSFIAPFKVISAITLFVLCVLCILYFEDFIFTADLLVLLGAMLLSNGLFVVLTLKLLYGKKQDPHLSNADRAKGISANLNSFVFTSIIISVYFILNRSVDVYGLQSIEVIFNSLYWQFVVFLTTGNLLRNSSLNDVDFEVYRA
jgi:hypothetical protein